VQGNLVLEDFNIMEEAGGAGKGIIREFNVPVNGSTLEIHLYWKGKGTTAIPDRGVYGPLISAITVTPSKFHSCYRLLLFFLAISCIIRTSFSFADFKVDIGGGGLSAGAIAGIVVASCVFIVLVLAVLRYMGYLGGKDLEDKGKDNLFIQIFSLLHQFLPVGSTLSAC
jgi:hypothetical protein